MSVRVGESVNVRVCWGGGAAGSHAGVCVCVSGGHTHTHTQDRSVRRAVRVQRRARANGCGRRGVCGARVAAAIGLGAGFVGAVGTSTRVCRRVLRYRYAAEPWEESGPVLSARPPSLCPVSAAAPRRGTGGETGGEPGGGGGGWSGGSRRPGTGSATVGHATFPGGRGVAAGRGAGAALPGCRVGGDRDPFPRHPPTHPGSRGCPFPVAGHGAPRRFGRPYPERCRRSRAARPALPSAPGRLSTKLPRSHF